MYEMMIQKFVDEGFGFQVEEWGPIDPAEIAEEMEGSMELFMFMTEIGLKGSGTLPKGRYTQFADWLCFEYPGEFRKVEG